MIRLVGLVCLAAGLAASAAAQGATPPAAPSLKVQGAAYQYEGKWMAKLQSSAGTELETIASCANPIVFVAKDATTLQRDNGQLVTIASIDAQTYAWMEGGRSTVVTPSTEGNFVAMAYAGPDGRIDYGRVVTYLRCGTAGATAASQICVAN